MKSFREYLSEFSLDKSGMIKIHDFDLDKEITITVWKKGLPSINLSTRIIKINARKTSYKCETFDEALSKAMIFLEGEEKDTLSYLKDMIKSNRISEALAFIDSQLVKK